MKIIEADIPATTYPVGDSIDKNKDIIAKMAHALMDVEEFRNSEINLICRGSSGAIIAAIIAMVIPVKSKIVHIKKEGEKSHDTSLSMWDWAKNVIVDDFIDTGETMNKIYKALMEYDEDIEIDCICVTGSGIYKIDFESKIFISSY